MLPWLMERGEVPLAEVARRFGLTPDEVAADLELAAMCGLPPFVDEMIDVFIDDDIVVVGVPRLFTRPLRLTAPEGFALVAAGRAAMQLPGADPRRAARPRAARSWPRRSATTASSSTCPITPAVDGAHRASSPTPSRAVERLRVEYWTPSRDEVTERTITPRRVFNDRGEWYVVADDGRSGERRTFRIDRIESIERDRRARRRADAGDVGRRRAGVVRRRRPAAGRRCGCAPAATWVVERYPVDDVVERRRRRRRARRSRWPASAGWSGCCCGSGTEAEVRRAGRQWRARSARDAAARLLARYAEAGRRVERVEVGARRRRRGRRAGGGGRRRWRGRRQGVVGRGRAATS